MGSYRTTDQQAGAEIRRAACCAPSRPSASRILAMDFDTSGWAIRMWAADEGSPPGL